MFLNVSCPINAVLASFEVLVFNITVPLLFLLLLAICYYVINDVSQVVVHEP